MHIIHNVIYKNGDKTHFQSAIVNFRSELKQRSLLMFDTPTPRNFFLEMTTATAATTTITIITTTTTTITANTTTTTTTNIAITLGYKKSFKKITLVI